MTTSSSALAWEIAFWSSAYVRTTVVVTVPVGLGVGKFVGTGVAVGVGVLGTGDGAGDGANVFNETDSTDAADIPPVFRRRRWPSSLANALIAAVSISSLTAWLSTLLAYSRASAAPFVDAMTSGTVISFITLIELDAASAQTASEKVALGTTEPSASPYTVALKSVH